MENQTAATWAAADLAAARACNKYLANPTDRTRSAWNYAIFVREEARAAYFLVYCAERDA